MLRKGKGLDIVYGPDQPQGSGQAAGRRYLAGGKAADSNIILIEAVRILPAGGLHVHNHSVVTGTDQLHGTALSRGGLDVHQARLHQLAHVHGYGTVSQI